MRRFRAPRISDPTQTVEFLCEDYGDSRPCYDQDGNVCHGFTAYFRIGYKEVFSKTCWQPDADIDHLRELNDTEVLRGYDVDVRDWSKVTSDCPEWAIP
jgi:hypothetical protein